MTWEQEEKLKEMAQAQAKTTSTPYGAMLGGQALDYEPPCRTPLRERVAMDLRRAIQDSRKAKRLAELDGLLGKNPEIARILDLVEEVWG